MPPPSRVGHRLSDWLVFIDEGRLLLLVVVHIGRHPQKVSVIAARCRAIASPIPDAAPVTTARCHRSSLASAVSEDAIMD